jgi:hypothetical protein
VCFELLREKEPNERNERASDDGAGEALSSPRSRKLLTWWSLAPGAPEPERPFDFDDDLLNIGQGERRKECRIEMCDWY